ncbi:hypothetical protein FRB93_004283 [Tulasnella sp. JGI-2019a]|nr:hypothetical protein FRB93_004283 [Tulasnella sp. JGI-2019a]
MASAVSLLDSDTKIKVSSTLDRSVGKKHLTDRSPGTCWTSAQGLPQYIQLSFPNPVTPTSVTITFQGGFVGTRCCIYHLPSTASDERSVSPEWVPIGHIFPEDVNRSQRFTLSSISEGSASVRTSSLKLVFEESSDFFGRVTIYNFDVEGSP